MSSNQDPPQTSPIALLKPSSNIPTVVPIFIGILIGCVIVWLAWCYCPQPAFIPRFWTWYHFGRHLSPHPHPHPPPSLPPTPPLSPPPSLPPLPSLSLLPNFSEQQQQQPTTSIMAMGTDTVERLTNLSPNNIEEGSIELMEFLTSIEPITTTTQN